MTKPADEKQTDIFILSAGPASMPRSELKDLLKQGCPPDFIPVIRDGVCIAGRDPETNEFVWGYEALMEWESKDD